MSKSRIDILNEHIQSQDWDSILPLVTDTSNPIDEEEMESLLEQVTILPIHVLKALCKTPLEKLVTTAIVDKTLEKLGTVSTFKDTEIQKLHLEKVTFFLAFNPSPNALSKTIEYLINRNQISQFTFDIESIKAAFKEYTAAVDYEIDLSTWPKVLEYYCNKLMNEKGFEKSMLNLFNRAVHYKQWNLITQLSPIINDKNALQKAMGQIIKFMSKADQDSKLRALTAVCLQCNNKSFQVADEFVLEAAKNQNQGLIKFILKYSNLLSPKIIISRDETQKTIRVQKKEDADKTAADKAAADKAAADKAAAEKAAAEKAAAEKAAAEKAAAEKAAAEKAAAEKAAAEKAAAEKAAAEKAAAEKAAAEKAAADKAAAEKAAADKAAAEKAAADKAAAEQKAKEDADKAVAEGKSKKNATKESEHQRNERIFKKDVLEKLRLKIIDLEMRQEKEKASKDPESLQNAKIRAAQELYTTMEQAGKIYFGTPPTTDSATQFQTTCDDALAKAHETLDIHEDWYEILINIALAIATLTVGLLVKGVANVARGQSFFSVYQTDSHKKLLEIKETTANIIKPKT